FGGQTPDEVSARAPARYEPPAMLSIVAISPAVQPDKMALFGANLQVHQDPDGNPKPNREVRRSDYDNSAEGHENPRKYRIADDGTQSGCDQARGLRINTDPPGITHLRLSGEGEHCPTSE